MKYRFLIATMITALFIMNIGQKCLAQQPIAGNDIPRYISYQGLLTTKDGSVLQDGVYRIAINLYGDEAGKERLWQDTYDVSVSKGIFSVNLGSGSSPLPEPGMMNRPLWIGIQANGAEVMRPLTMLTSSPYAMNVADGSVTSAKIAEGAITAGKMDADYISGITIGDRTISQRGMNLKLQGIDGISVHYNDSTQTLSVGTSAPKSTEKGRVRTLGAATDAWAMGGDGVDNTTGTPTAAPTTTGNWIGTSNGGSNTLFDFIVKVKGVQVMKYQPNGTTNTPNIVGGNSNNIIDAGAVGAVIAGGGVGSSSNLIYGSIQASVIGGGADNKIDTVSYAVVAGGLNNRINGGAGSSTSVYASIGGGYSNNIYFGGATSHIGGGEFNDIFWKSDKGVIAGGSTNTIDTNTRAEVIGGGYGNWIHGGKPDSLAYGSTVAGGSSNNIGFVVQSSSIGGGSSNQIKDRADWSVISGGKLNLVDELADYGSIGGGSDNAVLFDFGTVSGGTLNQATATYATLGGGGENIASGQYATIGGGNLNEAQSGYSFIGGGQENLVVGDYSVVGGGQTNKDLGTWSAIGGGESNYIGADLRHNFIGGGINNKIYGQGGTIGGGDTNYISSNSTFGSILGGQLNYVDATAASIAGGVSNRVNSFAGHIGAGADNDMTGRSDHSTIGAGKLNHIDARFSVIGGGYQNAITAAMYGGGFDDGYGQTIGGGSGNTIKTNGWYATIPGGDNLTAKSYGQTVIGIYNQPKGNMQMYHSGTGYTGPGPGTNDPLFIIGNGVGGAPSNAFEVSYNGHSLVTDVNGPGAGRPVGKGGTYVDNVIYAWGDVAAGGTITSDFGVASVVAAGGGVYTITLNMIADPSTGGATIPLASGAAVTATLADADESGGCGTILVSKLTTVGTNSTFTVKTFNWQVIGPSPVCDGANRHFMFHVTGRP